MLHKHVNKYCNYGWIFTVDPFRQKDSQKVPPTVLLILIGLAKFIVVIMTKNSNLTGEIKWKIIRKIWKFKKQDSLTPGFIDRFFCDFEPARSSRQLDCEERLNYEKILNHWNETLSAKKHWIYKELWWCRGQSDRLTVQCSSCSYQDKLELSIKPYWCHYCLINAKLTMNKKIFQIPLYFTWKLDFIVHSDVSSSYSMSKKRHTNKS